ncbi:MAG: hypothetical protein WCT49_04575 [Candidatus Paceibacterota bacterium]|jgi:hypothetical protein|nr:hypothetical protein [Candidatus Paceibacterota bacterium]
MSYKRIVGLVVIVLLLIAGFFVFSKSSKKAPQETLQVENAVKQIVSSFLKSPGSAQFPEIIVEKQTTQENKYIAFGDVDSQNGFGALLRSHFFLVMFGKGGDLQNKDNWTIDILSLDNMLLVSGGKIIDSPFPLTEELITSQKQLEDSIRAVKK